MKSKSLNQEQLRQLKKEIFQDLKKHLDNELKEIKKFFQNRKDFDDMSFL